MQLFWMGLLGLENKITVQLRNISQLKKASFHRGTEMWNNQVKHGTAGGHVLQTSAGAKPPAIGLRGSYAPGTQATHR